MGVQGRVQRSALQEQRTEVRYRLRVELIHAQAVTRHNPREAGAEGGDGLPIVRLGAIDDGTGDPGFGQVRRDAIHVGQQPFVLQMIMRVVEFHDLKSAF